MPRWSFVLGLLLIASPALLAQSYLVRTYNENDGLLNSNVNALAQDAAGRIWFATRSGISVYDGSEWVSYSVSRGLPISSVTKLAIDPAGTVWAWGENPSEALLRLEEGRWRSIPRPPSKRPGIRPSALLVTGAKGEETAYLGTELEGLFAFQGGQWRTIGQGEGLPSDSITGLAELGPRLYVSTPKGLAALDGGRLDLSFNEKYPILKKGVYGLAAETAPEGSKLWLAGKDWLGTLANGRLEVLSDTVVAHVDTLYPNLQVLPDSLGGAYYGNPYSVFHFHSPAVPLERLGQASGFIAEGVTAFLEDREKNVWIAGLRGVSKIAGRRFANFRKAQGLLEDEVTALASWKSGMIFGHNVGLTFWDGTAFKVGAFAQPLAASTTEIRVLDIAVDTDGNAWIAATNLGLGRISRDRSLSWIGEEAGVVGRVNSVAADPAGGIWIAASNGLLHLSGKKAVPMATGRLKVGYIRKIFIDPKGELLLATSSNGLWRGTGQTWTQFSLPDNRNANNVFAALIDRPGRLLAGTADGLYEIKDGAMKRFAPAGLKIERPVYLLLEDPGGRLWIGTDNGVVRWDGKASREFTIKSGFAGQEVNRAAGLVDPAGRVWIGTNQGVSRYDEKYDFDPASIPPPLVRVEVVEAGGKRPVPGRDIVLPARSNDLECEFRAVSLIDETSIRYRYRLDGHDLEWSPDHRGGQGQIRYASLPPGRFAFQVQAANALGRWSEPLSSPSITILKPLTGQWWFYLLAGVAAFLLSFVAFEFITQRRTARRLEKSVRERTAQIQASLEEKDILLREVHHRVKNNLQIVSSLLYLQSRKIRDASALAPFQESMARVRAMALIHENLYQSESLAFIDMAEYIRRLGADLVSTFAVEPGRIGIEVLAEKARLPMETAIACGLIVNELVANAFKHAYPGERKGTVTVEFRQEGAAEPGSPLRSYLLSVADDGAGLPAGFEKARVESLGLRLVRNLTEQIGGELKTGNRPGATFEIRFRA